LVCAATLLAQPAAAQLYLECSSWRRLSQEQKLQTIDRTIEDLVSGSRGRESASINRTRTRRFLESHRHQMVGDFDDLCVQGMRADLQALNKTFRSYAWSCAQQARGARARVPPGCLARLAIGAALLAEGCGSDDARRVERSAFLGHAAHPGRGHRRASRRGDRRPPLRRSGRGSG
jgi:hypothetical protein